MFKRILVTLLISFIVSVSSVNAALYEIEFIDVGNATWTGQVNTTTDTLTIETWVSVQKTGGFAYQTLLTPAVPMVWDAVYTPDNATVLPYDIPDAFNGNFNGNWGFLSPIPLSAMTFLDGSYNSAARPGWNISDYGNGYIPRNTGTNRITPWPRISGSMSVDADSIIITEVVPIPGAAILFTSGLLGIMGFRRRMNN